MIKLICEDGKAHGTRVFVDDEDITPQGAFTRGVIDIDVKKMVNTLTLYSQLTAAELSFLPENVTVIADRRKK